MPLTFEMFYKSDMAFVAALVVVMLALISLLRTIDRPKKSITGVVATVIMLLAGMFVILKYLGIRF